MRKLPTFLAISILPERAQFSKRVTFWFMSQLSGSHWYPFEVQGPTGHQAQSLFVNPLRLSVEVRQVPRSLIRKQSCDVVLCKHSSSEKNTSRIFTFRFAKKIRLPFEFEVTNNWSFSLPDDAVVGFVVVVDVIVVDVVVFAEKKITNFLNDWFLISFAHD